MLHYENEVTHVHGFHAQKIVLHVTLCDKILRRNTTVERDRVTCPECRRRLGMGPVPVKPQSGHQGGRRSSVRV